MYILAAWTDNDVPKTGLSALISIWNVASTALLIDEAAMTEITPGLYKYDYVAYDPSIEITGWCDAGEATDSARFLYFGNRDDMETRDKIDRILGLLHSNIWTVPTWTGDNMTSAIVEIYNTEANATTHDGVTGLIGKYLHTATYSGSKVTNLLTVKDT